MIKNHLNQFPGYKHQFVFETCIHFPINAKVKHLLVVDKKRKYDMLNTFEILEWRRKFGEII